MAKITKEEALRYHSEGKPGKIEVIPTKPYSTQTDLSLAYSPGVAEPCLEIEKEPLDAYKYTSKGNLVAVISNGTAVLGLGNIGALAGKPVMEGKGLLFKIFAGIDVFDIEVDQKDPDKFIETVKAIAPTFGGINLEDIKAPECFQIEQRLKAELDIPVMHDDQHGTAIISGAGLLNALEIAGKKIEDVKIVVNGAGAASISCTKLYVMLGARKENIIMCDSKGVISTHRTDLNESKKEFATTRDIKTMEEAVVGTDVFLGLSVANVLTQEMVRSMNENPIVFALANPNPEISYADAMASREDIIFATGRSDYPNQINNVLGFPYIFRGALDTHAKAINEEMKLAAVHAIAELAKEPVPDVVNAAYKLKRTTFGRDYILPKALDPRLLTRVSVAVAKAAIESGVSRKTITDWEGYANHLREMMGYDNKLLRSFTDMAKANPKRVVFAEANHVNMLKAAVEAKAEGICYPILLGNEERLEKIAAEENLSLEGIEIVNLRHDREEERRDRYARILSEKRAREGVTFSEAREKMANASTMAGMAFANAFLGVCHSMAHKLGAFHHLPHGVANALLISLVVEFNSAEAPTKMGTFSQYQYPHTQARYAECARFCGIQAKDDAEAVKKLIEKIEELKAAVGIKKTIAEYGIDEKYFLDNLDAMVEQAFDDQCTGANPRYPLMSEIKEMYLRAYYGK